jgi:hypothetical protein
MSFSIDQAFVQQFKSNLYMLAQQKGSKLRKICREEPVTGEYAWVERIGSVEAVEVTSRHADTPILSTPHTKRRIDMRDFIWADLIDDLDKVKMLIDPTSPYVQTATYALGRKMDIEILRAIFGSAYNKAGTATNSYDSGECRLIEVDAATAVTAGAHLEASAKTEAVMTIDTIRLAKYLLDSADIDPDRKRYFICSPAAIWQLLIQTEIASSDYNTIKALASGQIGSYMGFDFVTTTLINSLGGTEYGPAYNVDGDATADSTISHFAAVADGAVCLGVASDIKASIDKRPDKNNAMQVFASMSGGAVRIEGPACVLGGYATDAAGTP